MCAITQPGRWPPCVSLPSANLHNVDLMSRVYFNCTGLQYFVGQKRNEEIKHIIHTLKRYAI